MRTFFGASKAALHKFEAMFFKLFFIILGIIIIVLRISDEVKTSALPFKSLFFSNGKNTELKIKFFFGCNFLTFQKYIVRSINLCELYRNGWVHKITHYINYLNKRLRCGWGREGPNNLRNRYIIKKITNFDLNELKLRQYFLLMSCSI